MIKKVYIAGPLFNSHEKHYLEKISQVLEGNGFDCFLPHRDQIGISEKELENPIMTAATKEKIFNNDLNALEDSDLTVALLTGQDIDSGTAAEIGKARDALGVVINPCYPLPSQNSNFIF